MATRTAPGFRGSRLREARMDAGLSQEALGERIGQRAGYVSDLERGVRTPGMDMALRIVQALPGVSLDWLMGLD